MGLALVIDAELFRLEGVVRWLDAADARLGRVEYTPDSGEPAPDSVAAPEPTRHDGEVGR